MDTITKQEILNKRNDSHSNYLIEVAEQLTNFGFTVYVYKNIKTYSYIYADTPEGLLYIQTGFYKAMLDISFSCELVPNKIQGSSISIDIDNLFQLDKKEILDKLNNIGNRYKRIFTLEETYPNPSSMFYYKKRFYKFIND